ncbi:MAG: alcohol dehydrogenase catalytic domain-containing protein [Nitrosopumilaceae archaeon]|nr:alcohol dehydrogenase catalytic domain-containing protein [Nitrosopumilaceae archaeon]NIU00093.1 alcohol dehydrogenase catalytic domain-containing protein [Nitrosopumilaceae archaeon]NIU86483.1 alcohol dehydrogenase catalytic domain-containing protein [Nitrosopumilaceae archaeon]NIV65718.1 alcohol dehydrogenase catalytic domain-containing protein [Nitrosopumilaceae archaeon]NIX60695.1 alcohol dehydrogenase catalytic domain-containing protein [Nitrosopumilaceae archaeon]
MKAARITGPNESLQISDLESAKPQGKQILVKVKSVGVCHSDLHLWEGGYDLGDGTFMKVTDRGVKYPVTPGHEIVGTVDKVGPEAKDVSIGDEVLVYPWIGEGNCPACKDGNENLCDTPKSLGIFQDGGYADYVLIPDQKYVTSISGVDPDAATSLACSALTAYTAAKKANYNAPEFLVVIGAGGLGLMGIQLAKEVTNAKIICVDLDDDKLEKAKEMGADHTFNSKDPDVAKNIMSTCNDKGAESVIDFVNAPPTFKLGLSILRKRGNLVLVGLFGGKGDIQLVTIPLKSVTIRGAYTGNLKDMKELVDLAKKGIIKPIISKHYQLSEANNALEDLKERKIVGRAVINP